MGRKKVVDGRN
jgi:hypothetical protein